MQTFIKKISIFSLLASYSFLGVFGVLFAASTPVNAASESDLCIPPLTALNEDFTPEEGDDATDGKAERWSPRGGWLQVEIINRATFSVSVVRSAGNCQAPLPPNTISFSYISADEPEGSFAALLESIMVDKNLDNDFDYRRSQDKNSDDHRIDEIYFPNDVGRIDGKRILRLDTNQIAEALRKAELVIGIEEDDIPTVKCNTGKNDNFYLRIKDKSPEWYCSGSLLGDWRGINIGTTSFTNVRNFNVVYNVSEDGTKLDHVAEGNRGNDSFTWCGALEVPAFRDGCIDGKLELKGVTPETLAAQADNEYIEIEVVNTENSDTGFIVAAGANTTSANVVFDSGQLAGESAPTCESEGGVFGWVLCPILSWSSQALEVVEGWITNRLELGPEYYADEGVRGAWARIRNVAYIVLIPILLVMVISTALGFSFVDAYTVKRALPRLFIAIIFMALSYNVMVLMIQIVNDLGRGIGGLIAAPFGGSQDLTLQAIFNPTGGDSAAIVLGGGVVLAGLALGAISVVSVGVLASYMFVAALALLSVFFTLVLRQMLLLGMIIIAPLAILSWIFPGNDKVWKIFWGGFTKLLLLYPIIVAALITGRAFASIIPPGQGAIDSVLVILLKLTAYIAPFFLIPAVFRYAGGAFANIAGIVNNRSKGVFDKQRKYRDEKKAFNKQKSENFSRFSDNNPFGRRANTLIGATRGKNLKGTMRGRSGINEMRAAGQINQGQDDLKNDAVWQANQNDDNFQIAVANRQLAQEKLDAAQRKVDDTSLSDEERESARAEVHARQKGLAAAAQVKSKNSAGTRRAALNAWMKSGYNLSEGEEGYNEVARTVDSIANGDLRARAAMMNEAQYHSKSAGHAHMGGINNGNGYDPLGGIKKSGLYQLANGKTDAISAWGEAVLNGGDTEAMATHLSELKSMQSNTTGANRDEVNRQIEMLEKNPYLQAAMSQPTGNTSEVSRRIDYDSGKAATDPAYAAQVATWTKEERDRGWRTETRTVTETMGDVARKRARSYEPPDPNKIET